MGFRLMLDLIPSPGKLLRRRTVISNEEREKLHWRLYRCLHFLWASGRLDASHGATKTTPFFPALCNKSYGYILVAMIFMRIEFCILTCSSLFKKHYQLLTRLSIVFSYSHQLGKTFTQEKYPYLLSKFTLVHVFLSPPSVGLTESV